MVRALVGDVHAPAPCTSRRASTFGLIVFAVFIVTIVLNFA